MRQGPKGAPGLARQPYPSADAARQARSDRLSAILELVAEADASIDWINGAEALAPFSRVRNQLLLHTDSVRRMVAKTYGLELESGLPVTRWKPYSAPTVSAA